MVLFCGKTNPKLENLSDMNGKEWLVLVPIILLIFWIGIYPTTFLDITETSTINILEQVQNFTIKLLN